MKKKDFFISYTGVDRDYAKWIVATLESNGYTTIVDYRDFPPGKSFILAMDEAMRQAERTIAVVSPDYSQAQYTAPEWATALANDPKGNKGLLIPVKVRPVELIGILQTIVYIDLVDLIGVSKQEEEGRKRLLSGIRIIEREQQKSDGSQSKKQRNPEYLVGLLDRKPQHSHFDDQIPERKHVAEGKAYGFCIFGPRNEWPNAVRFTLSHLLDEQNHPKPLPIIKPLETKLSLTHTSTEVESIQDTELLTRGETHLWKLLARRLDRSPEKTDILKVLESKEESHVFYRELTEDEVKNHLFIAGLLLAWSKLTFGANAPNHFLLLVCESDYLGSSMFARLLNARSSSNWYQGLQQLLIRYQLQNSLLPMLSSPTVAGDVEDWFKNHPEISEEMRSTIRKALLSHSSIPLSDLKEKIFPILQRHYTQ